MVDYREIIRLHSLNHSNATIAASLGHSRNTVSEVLKKANDHGVEWPIPKTLPNEDLKQLFYPTSGNNEGRKLPDFDYIHKELARPGVTLMLLWAEYCTKCEQEHTIPYQHTQFCDKYSAFAACQKEQLYALSASLVKQWRLTGLVIP